MIAGYRCARLLEVMFDSIARRELYPAPEPEPAPISETESAPKLSYASATKSTPVSQT